jgi:hypothetical protein
MLSNILPRLNPYVDERIGYHLCGLQSNTPTAEQIFCIRPILNEKQEYDEKARQQKAYDSVRRKVLYNTIRVWSTHETSQAD